MTIPSGVRSLHVLGSREPGGEELFFATLVSAMRGAGEDVLSLTPPRCAALESLEAAVPRLFSPMRGNWDLLATWRIRRAARAAGADVVQTYLGRAARLTRFPRGGRPVHVARLAGAYRLDPYRHAHAWVGITPGICDHLVRGGFPASRVFCIGHFADEPPRPPEATLSALRASLGVPDDALLLVSVGRLHPVKGHEDLLSALARLPGEIGGRALHCVLVGDGPLREALSRQAEDLGLSGRVHFAGWRRDVSPYYFMADAFLLPSRGESLGNVILEAWARGTPVVATRCPGPSALIENGENGLLAPVGDPLTLARVIETLFRENLGPGLAEGGLATLRARHSRLGVLSAYAAMYRELLGA